jgi:hypothetical protein
MVQTDNPGCVSGRSQQWKGAKYGPGVSTNG